MDNHIYMVYDDSSPESTRDADITHKALLDKGYRVIHKDVGYTSARYEYARVVVNS
jgi:hypothetical protein